MVRASSQTRLEWLIAGLGAATFCALLASYAAFRPIRDALVLDGHPDDIPWLFTATFLAVMVASPLWSGLLARGGHRSYVPRAFHAFALCAVGFAVAVASGAAPVAIGRVFYVWSSVFNLFVVSVFWSLLADLFGPRLARRVYGRIALGGTAGALLGPAITRLLVDTIGLSGILALSAALLEVAVLGVAALHRHGDRLAREPEQRAADHAAPAPLPADQRPTLRDALHGLRQLARTPYLLAICGYVACTAIAATFLYLEQASLVRELLPDRVSRTELFAELDLYTNALTAVLQGVVAGPLLGALGPGVVLAILPLIQVTGVSLLAAAPSLATLSLVQITARAATHGLTRPARELLFTVVSRDDKYRAKNAIDTVVYRAGDLGSAWLHKGLLALGAGTAALVAATVPLAVIWLALATSLGVGFRRRLSSPASTPASQEPPP